MSVKTQKKYHACKKNYICNPATYCENGYYVGSIINNSVIMCDEIVEEK